MFNLLKDLIGYTGTYNSNMDSYFVYGCIVLILLGVTVTIDLVYKLLLRFLPKDSK